MTRTRCKTEFPDLPISNNYKDMILPIASLHDVNGCINNWRKWRWACIRSTKDIWGWEPQQIYNFCEHMHAKHLRCTIQCNVLETVHRGKDLYYQITSNHFKKERTTTHFCHCHDDRLNMGNVACRYHPTTMILASNKRQQKWWVNVSQSLSLKILLPFSWRAITLEVF